MPFLEQQRQLQKTEKGHIHTYIYETVREQWVTTYQTIDIEFISNTDKIYNTHI